MGVDAVIFDWGGTLTPWHTLDIREIWRAYTTVYDPLRADELAGQLIEAEALTWAKAREHQRSGTLDDVLTSVGIEPYGSRHEEALSAYQEAWDPHTWTDPHVISVFEGLRDRGVLVGILSNTLWTRDYHEAVLARDGVLHLVTAAVFSSEIPWAKPHPEAFLSVVDALGVDDPVTVRLRRRPTLRGRARCEGSGDAGRPGAALGDPPRAAGARRGGPGCGGSDPRRTHAAHRRLAVDGRRLYCSGVIAQA